MIGGMRNFRFWCQKVLPLTYDNSLSYYEVLCKVVHYLNHVIADLNQIPDYIDEKVKEAFDDEHIKELISEVFRTLEDAISANNEGTNTHFSQDYPKLGTLVWHDNKLYETIRNIDQGDEIIPDVNIQLVNFGDMFTDFIDEVKKNFTEYDDGKRETASMDRPVHQLVWLDDVLYEVSKPINEGNAYIYTGVNTNVVPVTMDGLYQYILGLISDEVQTRQEEDARIELELTDLITSKVNVEAQTRQEEDARIELELTDLITSKVNLEAQTRQEEDARIELELTDLITSKVGIVQDEIGDLSFLTTSDRDNLVAAINEVNGRAAGAYDKADIRNYGGVADSVTDNTAAFNACMADNNLVYLPRTGAGTYHFTHPLNIDSANSVIGDEGVAISAPASVGTLFNVRGSFTTIKNLRIDTEANVFYLNSTQTPISYINIENIVASHANIFIYDNPAATNKITNLYIDKCYSFSTKGIGINLTQAFAFIFLNNVTIHKIGTIADSPCFNFEGCEGMHMTHCEAEGGLSDGTHAQHIGFRFVDCRAIWLERCMADTVDSHGFVFSSTWYVYMNSCVSSLCGGHGIAILSENCRTFLITNCYLHGRSGLSPAPAGCHGIYNYNGQVSVSNCEIAYMTGYGIANNSQGYMTRYDGITVHHCLLSFSSSRGYGIITNMISVVTNDSPVWGAFNHINNLINGSFA